MNKKWLCLTFLAFLVFLLATALDAAVFQDGFIHLEYDAKTWELASTQAQPETSGSRVLLSLQEKEGFEKYHSRLSVVREDIKFSIETPTGLAKYHRSVVDFLRGQRFQITNQKDIKLAGKNALEITANQRDFGLTYRQWVMTDGPRAYLITATTRIAKFEEKLPAIEAMAQSFKLNLDAQIR